MVVTSLQSAVSQTWIVARDLLFKREVLHHPKCSMLGVLSDDKLLLPMYFYGPSHRSYYEPLHAWAWPFFTLANATDRSATNYQIVVWWWQTRGRSSH